MITFIKRASLGLIVTIVFFSCLCLLTTPAYAKDYSLTKTDIVANVNVDASMDVSQSRTFEFDGNFTLMMIPLGSDVDFSVNSATLNTGSREITLEEVPFQTAWRTSGGAGKPSYSIDSADGTVYVFTTSNASTQTVKLTYTYTNALKIHDDVAELYWKFVSNAWEKTSENVTCTVNLPVPAGTSPSSEDIRAWGHGQLNGHVQNNADGIVKLNIDKVRAGEYAETRITFPTSWINDSVKSTDAYVQGSALDSILTEEKALADEANASRSQSVSFVELCIAIPTIFIIVTIVLFLIFGKEYRSKFTGKYWRDVPDPEYHPAVVARNERWDKNSTTDISATIMRLHVNGFITVEPVTQAKKGIFGTKNIEDFIIAKVPNITPPTDPIDAATMKFLFKEVHSSVKKGKGERRQIYISDISRMTERNPESAKYSLDRWQAVLDDEVFKKYLFEATGATIGNAYKVIAGILVVLAILGFIAGGNVLNGKMFAYFLAATLIMLAVAIIAIFFSKKMNRRTHHANEVHAKTKALKKWLCEFTTLDERPALDTKIWGEFMVYATILGVADKAMKQMKIAEPAMFEDDYLGTTGYLPWWFWCSPNMHGGTFGNSSGGFDALEHAFSNFGSKLESSFSDAGSTLESAFAGDWSVGSGIGGGGFSGDGSGSFGGGGGFGDGGFGGAR